MWSYSYDKVAIVCVSTFYPYLKLLLYLLFILNTIDNFLQDRDLN